MAILDIYEIRSCDMFGQSNMTHALADQLDPAHQELNTVGTFTFSLPGDDPSYEYCSPITREVQVWRGTQLMWWGVVTDRRWNLGRWEIACSSLEWYFTKRVIGKVGRNNYLNNGSFQTGDLTGWTPVGVTTNVVTQWGTHAGSYQVNLYQGGSGQDTFLTQTVMVQPGYYTLAAWFQIRTDNTYVGAALDGRGLYVERLAADNVTVDDVQFFAITDDTERGVFQRATTNIQVDNPNTFLRIRLYATRCTNPTPTGGRPPGSIIWADTQLVLQDSQSFPYPSDLGDLFNNLTLHAQDPAYGKSNVNILANNGSSGIAVDRTYNHSDHEGINDAFTEWSDAGLCDYGVVWDQNLLTRSMRLFPGQRGSVLTGVTLEIDGNVQSVPTIEENGDQTFTSIITTGQGSGPDTDEGGAIDTSLTGGIVLEEIQTARDGSYYDQLNLQSAETLAKTRGSFQIPSIVCNSRAIGLVNLGDSLPALYTDGALNGEVVRVNATDLDLTTDQLTLTVLPVT